MLTEPQISILNVNSIINQLDITMVVTNYFDHDDAAKSILSEVFGNVCSYLRDNTVYLITRMVENNLQKYLVHRACAALVGCFMDACNRSTINIVEASRILNKIPIRDFQKYIDVVLTKEEPSTFQMGILIRNRARMPDVNLTVTDSTTFMNLEDKEMNEKIHNFLHESETLPKSKLAEGIINTKSEMAPEILDKKFEGMFKK